MSKTEYNYLKDLNEVQAEAVKNTEGAVMIVAGAGSGKTRVLTFRIGHLLNLGIDPFNILALTFTNKAAREMRDRIEKIAGAEAKSLWMGTFHSVFARILRSEAQLLGFPRNFVIYDTQDSKSLIKSIVKEYLLDPKLYKANLIYSRISSAKNDLIGPEEYAKSDDYMFNDMSSGRGKIVEIYREYQNRCFKAGAMDFDDLLLNTFKLFDRFPEQLYKYQHRFKYILVDEYQDTNHVQYRIVKMLAAVFRNICVVGDDAQSIYAFRGASIANILNFEKDYPDYRLYKLEQNYRSTKTIVKAATNVIGFNKKQIPKALWTQNQDGDKIRLYKANTDSEEGRIVAREILEEKMQFQKRNEQFAVLYRTNAQSRAMEEGLRKNNIPYRVYGGLSFYQRKEIKDLLAYLRLSINTNDEEAFKRVINYPKRGIGTRSVEKLMVLANESNKGFWEIAEKIEQYRFGASARAIADFVIKLKSFQSILGKKDAYESAQYIARESGVQRDLYEDKSIEGLSKYENLEELLNGIREYVSSDDSEDKHLAAYLQNIALLTTTDTNEDDDDKVTLMTIHSSKGLEFGHVFVVGLEEGLFPSQHSLVDRAELEEERRLFYVALTRAMDKLSLTYSQTRFRHGSMFSSEPSRFLEELGEEHVVSDRTRTNFTSRESFGSNDQSTRRSTIAKQGTRTALVRNKKALMLPENPDFNPDNPISVTTKIQVGMEVEHNRFGKGKVLSLEGNDELKKATIFFPGHGQKEIMLKFAKIRLIQ